MTLKRTFYATLGDGRYKWYQVIGHDFSRAVDICKTLKCPMHITVTEHHLKEREVHA